MKRRRVILFGLLLLTFSICLLVVSCVGSDAESHKANAPDSDDADDNNSMDILVPDHDHIYELTVLVPPSCGVEGIQAYVCVICGKLQHQTSVEALPHNYKRSDILSAWPTCTTAGKSVYCCGTCGCTQSEVLEAIGHRWRTKITCDSNTNELIITPYCTVCQFVSSNGYRYKINDVEKLIDINGQFAECGGYSSSGGVIIKYYQNAPYYRVFCTDTNLLIVRNVHSFMQYSEFGSIGDAVRYYTSCGCTVVYEANISITPDGRIQIIQ